MKSAIAGSWRAATSMWYIELELKLISEVKRIEKRRIYNEKGVKKGDNWNQLWSTLKGFKGLNEVS